MLYESDRSMSEYIVEMKHITKTFPGIVANDDVSIQIRKGEIFALLGENGAGKSTLMGMLYGMYEPDRGEIFIRGKKVRIYSPNHAARLKIGMVHQHFRLVNQFSIAENIVMGKEPVKKIFGILPCLDLKKAREDIIKLSKHYGLEVEPDQRMEEGSVSVKQRVEILKMLYQDSEILIFDEPTAMLAPKEIESLLKLMRELRNNGKTIILITHKLEEIKQLADRCAILCRGRVKAVLEVESASAKKMAGLMVGREISFARGKKLPVFGDMVLRVEDLTINNKDKFPVVKAVSFSIRGGEIFALAGVSGNGQEEIAHAIAGLVSVAGGSIFLKGRDITHYGIRRRNAEGISYIPEDRQKYGLVLDLSLGKNLVLKDYYREPFLKRGLIDEMEIEKYGNDLIEKYHIRCSNGIHTQVRSMSGGNQQKAVIAREIERQPSLLLFVQPARGLDIGAIEEVRKQMIRERDSGKAILLISLELEEIMNCADTIGILYKGELKRVEDANTLTIREVGEYMAGVRS